MCPFLLQALLAFLNTEAERLVGRHTAITSAAAAAMAAANTHSRSSSTGSNAGDADSGTPRSSRQQRPSRPGHGLFRAMQKGLLGLGAKLQGQDSSPACEAAGAGSQPQQGSSAVDPAQVIAHQWLLLSQLCWCPVLAEPPDAALPWRGGTSGVDKATHSTQQRLAAPCAVRPAQDLWLVSAVKGVVDGECHSQVAVAGLGW
jgi:hypothetical protein